MQVKNLTTDELKRLIHETILEVLEEFLQVQDEEMPDPDKELEIRPEIQQQLLASRQRRAKGERGLPAAEVAQRFGMIWK